MKKYDRNTRQGRARRANATRLFNPDTGLPHNAEMRAELGKRRKELKQNKALRWRIINDPLEQPVYRNGKLIGYRRLPAAAKK